MYKEKFKSTINPLVALIVWGVSIYLFNILWGIAQILFEFGSGYIKYLVCIGVTVWFGWNFIAKILTEYEVEVTKDKLTIYKHLSRRSKEILSIALNSITKIYTNKNDLQNHRISKKADITLWGIKENPTYIVYNAGKEEKCIILSGKKLVSQIKKNR